MQMGGRGKSRLSYKADRGPFVNDIILLHFYFSKVREKEYHLIFQTFHDYEFPVASLSAICVLIPDAQYAPFNRRVHGRARYSDNINAIMLRLQVTGA